jgi:DNA-binding NarL/FixJ family response regulator
MIRIFLVGSPDAMTTGLGDVLNRDPTLMCVGAARDKYELWPVLDRTEPDVVILDHHLERQPCVLPCIHIKARPNPPRVLIRSTLADGRLALAAMIAGADGLVPTNATAQELTDAIRQVSAGRRVMPKITLPILLDAQETLGPEDWPIVAMLLNDTLRRGAALTLRIDDGSLGRRIESILGRLTAQPLAYAA